MRYFLKKTNPSKKGLYLQIYLSYYVPKVGKRNKSFKSIGYVSDLIKSGIDDPITYFQNEVDTLNKEFVKNQDIQIGEVSFTKNAGYFLLKGMIDFLETDNIIRLVAIRKKFQFDFADFINSMIYAQVVSPGSKLAAYEKVLPSLYNASSFSYDQILDGMRFLGEDYEKYIEVFNHQIEAKFGKRKTGISYFDCTNYYFETDMVFEDKQKGVSKEERHCPIIGQALMLDENQIPIAMKMFPGNVSERPQIRDAIRDMKERYDIDSKIVQVADKGLNCARNIYSAVIESNDGYIFSKSVKGKNLSDMEKKWVLLEDNLANKWTNYYERDGKTLACRLKETIDTFEYRCKVNEEDTKETIFKVKEKRIVSYNPKLARKQRAEIQKEVERLQDKLTAKKIAREELGDAVKFVDVYSVSDNGKTNMVEVKINYEKINTELKYAGYNMIVTSEIKKSAKEIYDVYHGLWRIEESFRILKTYLESRPVFLQKKESIYGHFLICYLSLTILRLIELKVFDDEIAVGEIVNFIRQYIVTQTMDNSYINGATISQFHKLIKERLQVRKLGNAFLTKKDVDSLFELHLEDIL